MPPAARVSDLQVSPGGSGPLAAGSANVRIGGMPAARAGDATGTGGVIASGSPTVFIGGKPAARVGDRSSGGGVLLTGTPTVLIGDRAAVGTLEPIGGGANAGTVPSPATPRPGTTPGKTPDKGHTPDKKDKKDDKAAAKDSKGAAPGGTEGGGEGLTLLNSPATVQLVTAFLKMAEGLFGQLANALPPSMRDLVSTSLASAQKALGSMQVGALNQSVAQLQAALQQAQTTVPPEVMAQAAQNAQNAAAAPVDPASVTPPRLNVGEGSVLDSLPPPRKG